MSELLAQGGTLIKRQYKIMKLRGLILAVLVLIGAAIYWKALPNGDDVAPYSPIPPVDSYLTTSSPEMFEGVSEPIGFDEDPSALDPAPIFADNRIPLDAYAIQGKVVDKRSGVGIPEVTVCALVWDDSFNQNTVSKDLDIPLKVTSNADGEFWIPNVRRGIYGLMVHHDSFVQDRPAYKHTVNEETMLEQTTLILEPGAVVFGTVSWQGEPLKDQPVTLHYARGSGQPMTAYSDENGQFMFDGLADSSVTLRTTYEEHELGIKALLRRGKATVVDLLFSDYDSIITGDIYPFDQRKEYSVTAMNSAGDIFDAVVYADGAYTFEELSPANYRIRVQTSAWGKSVSKYDALIRTHSNSVSFCDFFTCDISNVSGSITNQTVDEIVEVYAVKNTMIAELNDTTYNQLRKSPLATPAEIDESGRFFFPELSTGYYTLIGRGEGERMACAMLEVKNGYPSPALFYEGDVAVLKLDDSWTHIAKEVQTNDSAGLQ